MHFETNINISSINAKLTLVHQAEYSVFLLRLWKFQGVLKKSSNIWQVFFLFTSDKSEAKQLAHYSMGGTRWRSAHGSTISTIARVGDLPMDPPLVLSGSGPSHYLWSASPPRKYKHLSPMSGWGIAVIVIVTKMMSCWLIWYSRGSAIKLQTLRGHLILQCVNFLPTTGFNDTCFKNCLAFFFRLWFHWFTLRSECQVTHLPRSGDGLCKWDCKVFLVKCLHAP